MATPGTTIPVGSKVSPSGSRGVRGLAGGGPVGSIILYGGRITPEGYLFCDGAWYEVSEYPELYSVIGDDFASDASAPSAGMFRVPDFRFRTPVGLGLLDGTAGASNLTLGQKFGAASHILTLAQIPAHSHTVNNHTHTVGAHAHSFNFDHYHSALTVNAHGHGDPTHAHGVGDPSHSHGYTAPVYADYFPTGGGASYRHAAGANTSAAHTGIWIGGAYTGLQNAGNPGGNTNYVSQTSTNWHIRNTDNSGAFESGGSTPGTNSQGGGEAHNNVQPSLGVNFCIKT